MRVAFVVFLVILGAFVFEVGTLGHSRERFAGEFDGVPDNVRSWFKGVRSPHGVPCCDISDGHRTQWDIRAAHYWIPAPEGKPGEWMEVPAESVVYNAGNPTGDAVVWWVRQGPNSIYIRCFVPGGGV
jgi:hypothetical protein